MAVAKVVGVLYMGNSDSLSDLLHPVFHGSCLME